MKSDLIIQTFLNLVEPDMHCGVSRWRGIVTVAGPFSVGFDV